jgi:hypothetical protein
MTTFASAGIGTITALAVTAAVVATLLRASLHKLRPLLGLLCTLLIAAVLAVAASLAVFASAVAALILLLLFAGADDHEYDHNANNKEHGEQRKKIGAGIWRRKNHCNIVHFNESFL